MSFWDVVVGKVVDYGVDAITGGSGGSGRSDFDRKQRKAIELARLYASGDVAAIKAFQKKNPGFMKEVAKGKWDLELGMFRKAAPVGTSAGQPFKFGELKLQTFDRFKPIEIGGALRKIPLGNLAKQLGRVPIAGAAITAALMTRAAIGPGHLGELAPVKPSKPDPLRVTSQPGRSVRPPARVTSSRPRPPVAPAGMPPKVQPQPVRIGNDTGKQPVAPGGKPAGVAPPNPPPAGPSTITPTVQATRVSQRVAPSSSAKSKPVPVPKPSASKPWWLEFVVEPLWPHLQTALIARATEDRERVPKDSPFANPPEPSGTPEVIPPGGYPFNAFRTSPLTALERQSADCSCPKKPRKPRKSRSVCYSGRYIERPNGLTKTKLRKVPCRPSRKKPQSRLAR